MATGRNRGRRDPRSGTAAVLAEEPQPQPRTQGRFHLCPCALGGFLPPTSLLNLLAQMAALSLCTPAPKSKVETDVFVHAHRNAHQQASGSRLHVQIPISGEKNTNDSV